MDEKQREIEAPEKLKAALKTALEFRTEIKELEQKQKDLQAKYDAYAEVILGVFESMSVDSIKIDGHLFYKETKTSVTTPKTEEEKKELFKFLEEKGLFYEVASVNSQTLNALYKSLAEEAASEGVLDFKLPGIGEPTIYTNLKIRKAK